jgi:hypothetical protein
MAPGQRRELEEVGMLRTYHVFVIGLLACCPAFAVPSLSGYFTPLQPTVIDSTYAPLFLSFTVTADLNGDGNQDLVVLGADYPSNGASTYTPQPGRVFFGDGKGGFTPAPPGVFPVSTLQTVHPRKVLFSDFNGDGRPDMFISSHGWDTNPFPGEQNRLYLSNPDGTWRDATAALPQLSDYSHTSAVGDINGDGRIDLFVGNGYSGQNGILPYMLMNQGGGTFALDRSELPVGAGQGMDVASGHMFPGATLADLDGDGLPDLIVTADASQSYNTLRQTTVYWNHGGTFSDADKTLLPATAFYAGSHIDLDAQAIDVNGDGRPDLVLTGTQGQPFYDGWFVQILVNQGNHVFFDETASRLPPGAMSGGSIGAVTGSPWGMWVRPIDFNGDGFPDFAIDFNPAGGSLSPSQPLVWLNDGTGHFTTLRVSDFVSAGSEWMLGAPTHVMATQNGYGFITLQSYAGSGGLVLTGILPSTPYRLTPSSASRPASVAECLFDWAAGNYSSYLGGATSSGVAGEYTYRHFADTKAYVAVSGRDNHLYYLGPASANAPLDLGPLANWLVASGCR